MFEINKIIITLIGVFLFTTAQAQVSWNTTTQIYARILNQNHLKWPRKLKLVRSNDMNAWADRSDTITVTTGLLKKIGYNHCDMSPFFYKLYKKYGNLGGANDPHSSNLTRYRRLNKGCNRGG